MKPPKPTLDDLLAEHGLRACSTDRRGLYHVIAIGTEGLEPKYFLRYASDPAIRAWLPLRLRVQKYLDASARFQAAQ